jgi:hypothetical protein
VRAQLGRAAQRQRRRVLLPRRLPRGDAAVRGRRPEGGSVHGVQDVGEEAAAVAWRDGAGAGARAVQGPQILVQQGTNPPVESTHGRRGRVEWIIVGCPSWTSTCGNNNPTSSPTEMKISRGEARLHTEQSSCLLAGTTAELNCLP